MTFLRSFLLLAILALPVTVVAQPKTNRNIAGGMPTKIQPFANPTVEDFVIKREQYVLSFNGKKNIPNWVSWNLTKADIGNASRGSFEPDPLLPRSFPHVTHRTYTESGLDRGHMCPSKDRSNTDADNDATFFMTNIIPQAPKNNQGAWERLESYCRDQLKKGHELHIVCGPYGVGGESKNGFMKSIDKGKIHVTVPAKTWKVILVLAQGRTTPDLRTRPIAVIVPNDQSVGEDWSKYRVSIREVEKLTGYRFFPRLNKEVATAIMDRVDDERVVVTPRPNPER
ncbi:MAG: DNA/RNA non-specific endonuclease [Gemmataceae bacterium]|nr:DNA/RNA non-specific endonuclease [Gemmataceae bacterium]